MTHFLRSVRRGRLSPAVASIALVMTGYGSVLGGCGVSNPMTPDQSRAQVVDAAAEVVSAANLKPNAVYFHHASCNDQHEAPFRGVVSIGYPQAASFDASDAEVAGMAERLRSHGWSSDDGDFKSHGAVLTKAGVTAVFTPQNVSMPNRLISLYGECRDVTTSKDDDDTDEQITLGQ